MEPVELWGWRYTDEFENRRVFPFRLTAEAAKQLKDAERIEGSLEIRKPLALTSDFLRSLRTSSPGSTTSARGSSSSTDSSGDRPTKPRRFTIEFEVEKLDATSGDKRK